MTPRQPPATLRHVRQLLGRAGCTGLTDAQLLQRFVAQRDEAAFEVLVWRHGPMALGVCRRILHNRHDAEDALQAALLTLARKAPAIARGGSVGSWLFKVAHRVALRARAQALRRARHEAHPAALADAPDPRVPDPGSCELGRVLDEELRQLAEKYRAPVVLCYLEGLTNEEAARHLGCPVGTLKTRLARARELLADRLARRGLAVGAGLLSASLFTPAAVPAGLVSRTARAAVPIVSGQGAAGVVSAPVANLTEGVLRAMTTVKARLLAATLAAGLAVAGTGVVSYRGLLAEPAAPAPTDPAARVEQIKGQIAALQKELRQAEQEAGRQKAEGPPKTIAVIFGNVPISRDELAEDLLARLSPEQLEAFVNRRILEHACRREGITVTDREVEAAVKEDLEAMGSKEQAFAAVLSEKYHKTLLEWKEDVVRPRLLMARLCRRRVRVTEKDIRHAFEARYGEKVECQVILWPRGQKQEAQREAEEVRKDEARFELKAGTQPNSTLALTNGRMKPFGRHGTNNEELEKAALRLRAGEISPLVDTPEGLLLIKCLRRLPADRGVDFEKVREGLREEVLQRLLQKEMSRMMQQLKEQARPRLLWTPRAASEGEPSHTEGN